MWGNVCFRCIDPYGWQGPKAILLRLKADHREQLLSRRASLLKDGEPTFVIEADASLQEGGLQFFHGELARSVFVAFEEGQSRPTDASCFSELSLRDVEELPCGCNLPPSNFHFLA